MSARHWRAEWQTLADTVRVVDGLAVFLPYAESKKGITKAQMPGLDYNIDKITHLVRSK